MDLSTILNSIRDPAVFLFCVAGVFHIHKETIAELKSQVKDVQSDYVSKEKLTDVVSPMTDQLKKITIELHEINTLIRAWK